VRVTGLADLFAEARELSVRTMIFDVEPLVAPWHGRQESLDQGIARILGDVRTVPSVRVLAYRLGFTFLHYAPKLTGVALGPELMHRWGELVRPLLFWRSATDR
jgi:hypothetical protein